MNPVIRRVFKWVLILGLIVGAGFWALGALGGDSDEHKRIIEEYLGEAVGMVANVEQLNSLNFFPSIIVDFEGLEIAPVLEGAEVEEPSLSEEIEVQMLGEVQVRAERVYMASGFRDVAWRSGKFQALEIVGFEAAAGRLMDQAVAIERAGVEHESEEVAFFAATGMIGERAFTVRTPVLVYGTLPEASYRFDGEHPIVLVMQTGERFGINYVDGAFVLEPKL